MRTVRNRRYVRHYYYAALLPIRGPHMRRTLSVCLSVCLSVRPVIVTSVTSRHLANYNDTYFSARAEGRISYGHLGRTNSCYYRVLRAMLSASRRQPRLLHVSAVDRRQTWSIGQELTMCDIVWVSPQSHSSLSVKPHFLWHALQWPWPVRKRFSSDHWRLWRSKPGSRIVRSTTKVELTTVADCQSSLHRLSVRTQDAWSGEVYPFSSRGPAWKSSLSWVLHHRDPI